MNASPVLHPEIAPLERLATCPRTVETGRFVYHQGDDVEAIYLIRRGAIRVARLTYEGDEVTIAHLGAGSYFGETEVSLGMERRRYFAQVTATAMIVPILAHRLRPEDLIELRRVAMHRLYEVQICFADMIALPPGGRVVSFLRYLAAYDRTVRLSHDELGRSVGCPRETVSRTLRQLEDAGVIRLDRCLITILAPEKLET